MNKYTIRLRAQVVNFIRELGPDEKKRFNRALTELSKGKGDAHVLNDPLADFYRLRIGKYRIIFWFRPGRTIECVHAGERSSIYDEFTPDSQ